MERGDPVNNTQMTGLLRRHEYMTPRNDNSRSKLFQINLMNLTAVSIRKKQFISTVF